jgi:hypothetical protein
MSSSFERGVECGGSDGGRVPVDGKSQGSGPELRLLFGYGAGLQGRPQAGGGEAAESQEEGAGAVGGEEFANDAGLGGDARAIGKGPREAG